MLYINIQSNLHMQSPALKGHLLSIRKCSTVKSVLRGHIVDKEKRGLIGQVTS
jgi:hypothetical protein